MEYRVRAAERRLARLAGHFKVVLVTGARQVGKSTLLRHAYPELKMVVFDPVQDLYGARRDPDLFLDSFPPPVILDEINYAPELVAAIKRRADLIDRPGQYLLTGSQNLNVLRAVGESMAGRVGILQLDGLMPSEMRGHGHEGRWLARYLADPGELLSAVTGTEPDLGPLMQVLWRGSMPALLDAPDELVSDSYRSYVQTYVERDVRTMDDIQELADFGRFLALAAALSAQEINPTQLGRELGISPKTARRWLDLLIHTYQWRELPPYHGNAIKRLTGKHKGYLKETGLICSLQRISSPEALIASPLLGAVFESWVVSDIHRQMAELLVPPMAHHWRTHGGAEVDLVLERDGRLHPIEIKCTTRLSRHDARGLHAFRTTYGDRVADPGVIIYAGTEAHLLADDVVALPWNARVAQGAA